ncbi:uncharacterized protein MONBRDRAFT_8277 [Monosiga brevicollis MX1]|uniref:Bifunctional lysine-specific demethylase and histidyl-hydroxylase n=1 Tax=Monosiga brevicollis TaxID=81824 RepID=A9UZK4_MONBE|nr:uncharacterized protein MONBRDRAFT_8277 [Monosiga brevicollis MX1]EDQ89384.1 predicted protein [Monosiga brevicollis MX1]|eukprot:XP_001745960.1 hypothetical protein [Monosiga brevicollis MX1]
MPAAGHPATLATLLLCILLSAMPAANHAHPFQLADLVGPNAASTFFKNFYRRNYLHISRHLDSLMPLDSWFGDLQNIDVFMTELYQQLYDDSALSFKTANSTKLPFPKAATWMDYSDQFYRSGQSAVIRREHMSVSKEPIEMLISDVFGSPEVTAHAYISAGQAHALKPHTDPSVPLPPGVCCPLTRLPPVYLTSLCSAMVAMTFLWFKSLAKKNGTYVKLSTVVRLGPRLHRQN